MEEKKKYTVLLVDDDEFLRDMYTVKLKEMGSHVIPCTGGQEAIRALEEGEKPDVIVLDMVMPAMNGIEFLEALQAKALAPGAARIILSNQSDPPEMEKAKALGVAGYIVKAETVPSQAIAEIMLIADKASQK